MLLQKREFSLFLAVSSARERKSREYQAPEHWAIGVKESGKGELNPPEFAPGNLPEKY